MFLRHRYRVDAVSKRHDDSRFAGLGSEQERRWIDTSTTIEMQKGKDRGTIWGALNSFFFSKFRKNAFEIVKIKRDKISLDIITTPVSYSFDQAYFRSRCGFISPYT